MASVDGLITGMSTSDTIAQLMKIEAIPQSALKTKQESNRAGILTLLAVLDAERDLYFVRRDYAKARYDYLLNRLRLKQSTGTLSDTDLEAIDRLLK